MKKSIRLRALFFLLSAVALCGYQTALSDASTLIQQLRNSSYVMDICSGNNLSPRFRPAYIGGFNDFPGDDQGWGGTPVAPFYMAISGKAAQTPVIKGSSSASSFSVRSLIDCLFGWITGGLFTAGQENDPPDERNSDWDRSEPDSELVLFEEMLLTIDSLLEQIQGNLVLVTDMDGTILADNYSGSEFRKRFTEYFNRWRDSGKLLLIIVTRAEIESVSASFFRQYDLPEPDSLISAPRGRDSTLRFHVRPGSPFRISTLPHQVTSHSLVVADATQVTIRRFGQFMEEMANSGYQIRNTKSFLINWLFNFISLNEYTIVSAGDTEDDQGLLQSASSGCYNVFSGIVVGNARENLREFMRGRRNIYLSHHRDLFGVVEGVVAALRRLTGNLSAEAQDDILMRSSPFQH